MDRDDKLLFDEWLWEMPQAQLDVLELSDLASAAAEAGVDFPQISATTAIVEYKGGSGRDVDRPL